MRTRRPLFNLANTLTLSRFVFAPIILLLVQRMDDPDFAIGTWKISLAVLIVLLVAILTDLFDGMVARARAEVTNFGKIMDPVADSTFFLTLMFGLSACRRFGDSVSLWFPMLILYREIAMHILRRYAALKGNAVPAKMSGKIKMFTQSVATCIFFLLVVIRDYTTAHSASGSPISEELLQVLVLILCTYTVAITYWSLIEYSHDVPELIAEYVGTEPGVKDGDGK
ncbi:MAG: CDP-alcohol phosphatidyltransferase family protein [Planctomycetaceae bacterium]|nr:CDP-alcohol phosphatidyltransferase family protein [Planctomycetaceae bacterium]